jgi:hypothetical protein
MEKVTIVPHRGSLGRYFCKDHPLAPDDIRINYAGALAEALVNQSPLDFLVQNGSRSDWRNARRNARECVDAGFIHGREKGTLIDELLKETRALVRRDKAAIAQVAEALLEHKTLTGEDIRRIVEAV